MPTLSTLKPFIAEEPTDFAALEVSCGKFIDAWLAAGGEPTDDEVIGFYSLWSQSLDARGKDEVGFFGWAYPSFVKYRDKVRNRIDQG
jgi:hypothetical protein